MRPDETQGLLPNVKIFSPLRSVDNRISVVVLFCTQERMVTEGVIMKRERTWCTTRSRWSSEKPSELKLCCELAHETNELTTSGNDCAVARRNTKHLFSSNFDLFLAFNKTFKPNQTCHRLHCSQGHKNAGVSSNCVRVKSYTLDFTTTVGTRSQQCEPQHRRVVPPLSWVRWENMLSDDVASHTPLTLSLCF